MSIQSVVTTLTEVRDRFFPKSQPEADRDSLWDAVQAALTRATKLQAEINALTNEVANKAEYASSVYTMHEESKQQCERLRADLDQVVATNSELRTSLSLINQDAQSWRNLVSRSQLSGKDTDVQYLHERIEELQTKITVLELDRDEWKEATILANQRFKNAESNLAETREALSVATLYGKSKDLECRVLQSKIDATTRLNGPASVGTHTFYED